MASTNTRRLTVLHFNDVYEIGSRSKEPVGGALRFATLIKSYFTDDSARPLVLFSGDALNPSILSTITKGRHMLSVLNELHVGASVVGNHDLDCGFEALHHFLPFCRFPWLLANVLNERDEPLPGIHPTYVIEHPVSPSQTVRVGLVGLVEPEWMAAIRTLPDGYTCRDPVSVGAPLVRQLRERGCDLVVCLAHMRWPRMELLAGALPELDLILGGHDHFYQRDVVNGVTIVVSGTEFRHLTELTVDLPNNDDGGRPSVATKQLDVTSAIAEDAAMRAVVGEFTQLAEQKMSKEIGYLSCEMDCRSAVVRTRETPIGNFLCDVARKAVDADCCILNSGTIRSDGVYPAGPFTLRDLMQILPFPTDTIVCIRLSGQKIWDALENGFSQYPATEGRFPQVSGISVVFDPARPPHARLCSVDIAGQPLDPDRLYTLATKPFLAQGLDGYASLKDHETVVDEEIATMLPLLVRHTFLRLKYLNILQWKERLARPFLTKPFKVKARVEGRITIVGVSSAS